MMCFFEKTKKFISSPKKEYDGRKGFIPLESQEKLNYNDKRKEEEYG